MEKIFNFLKMSQSKDLFNTQKLSFKVGLEHLDEVGNLYTINGQRPKDGLIMVNRDKIKILDFIIDKSDERFHNFRISKIPDGRVNGEVDETKDYLNTIYKEVESSHQNDLFGDGSKYKQVTVHLEPIIELDEVGLFGEFGNKLYYYSGRSLRIDQADKNINMGGCILMYKKFNVTVYGPSPKFFFLNGIFDEKFTVSRSRLSKLIFYISNQDNNEYPLKFSETKDGTHNGGVEYTDNIERKQNDIGTYTIIQVDLENAPNILHFYCENNKDMGSLIEIF